MWCSLLFATALLAAAVCFMFYKLVVVGPGPRHKNRRFLRVYALFGFLEWARTVLFPLGLALLLGVLAAGPDQRGLAISFILSAVVVTPQLRVSLCSFLCRVPVPYLLLVAPGDVLAVGEVAPAAGAGVGWGALLLPLLIMMMGQGGQGARKKGDRQATRRLDAALANASSIDSFVVGLLKDTRIAYGAERNGGPSVDVNRTPTLQNDAKANVTFEAPSEGPRAAASAPGKREDHNKANVNKEFLERFSHDLGLDIEGSCGGGIERAVSMVFDKVACGTYGHKNLILHVAKDLSSVAVTSKGPRHFALELAAQARKECNALQALARSAAKRHPEARVSLRVIFAFSADRLSHSPAKFGAIYTGRSRSGFHPGFVADLRSENVVVLTSQSGLYPGLPLELPGGYLGLHASALDSLEVTPVFVIMDSTVDMGLNAITSPLAPVPSDFTFLPLLAATDNDFVPSLLFLLALPARLPILLHSMGIIRVASADKARKAMIPYFLAWSLTVSDSPGKNVVALFDADLHAHEVGLSDLFRHIPSESLSEREEAEFDPLALLVNAVCDLCGFGFFIPGREPIALARVAANLVCTEDQMLLFIATVCTRRPEFGAAVAIQATVIKMIVEQIENLGQISGDQIAGEVRFGAPSHGASDGFEFDIDLDFGKGSLSTIKGGGFFMNEQ